MRKPSDIPTSSGNYFPPPGQHLCRCTEAYAWKSPKKGTPAAMLVFTTRDALFTFEDPVFVTPKAINRLSLVASRLCRIPDTTELSDDDAEAAKQLGRYILDNAEGKDAVLTIEEQDEKYMVETGPSMGQVRTKKRRRVAFGGYDRPPEEDLPGNAETKESEDIPF